MTELPLEQLKEYQGRNPRPADFDEFWARAMAELQTVDAKVEFRPASFRTSIAECFDLYFTGAGPGGSRVHAKYLRPTVDAEPYPAVLRFHGYLGSSSDWPNYLRYVAAGYSVAALDCRGQAGESEDLDPVRHQSHSGHIIRGLHDAIEGEPEKLLFRQIFLDTVQLAHIVMARPEVDENRVATVGASQGGGLSLVCAALERRIKKAAPIFPGMSDYLRMWELGVNDFEEGEAFFRDVDPQHQREAEIFNALGYIDIQHLAHRVRAEVLMQTGLTDTTCPPSTQFAAYNKITAPKDVVLYPDFGHEPLPGDIDRIMGFLADL